MSLEQLIQTGNYASAQQAFTAITTASVEVRDDQLWTWAGIAQLAGDETADALEQFLVSVGRTWVISQLGGRGLPLSDPKIQEMLLGLAPTIPGCAILAAQGLSLKAPWQVAGLPGAPTLQEVQAAWQAVQLANAARERLRIIQETRQQWDQVSQQIRGQIESGLITADQVTTAVQQLWS